MAEASQISFSYKEIAEVLIKKQGIHKGIWGLFIKFGIAASNVGPTDEDLKPAAIIPVLEIGLQKMEKVTSISVDAAIVNPKGARDTT